MKLAFLNFAMNQITATNKYDKTRLAELRYGLETFYMTFTKLIVLFTISIILNIYKEFGLLLLVYSPLRGLGFGFHANTSIECWIVSSIIFLLLPLIAKNFIIPSIAIQITIIISTIVFLIFAPADTVKKPLINKKKRLINKSLIIVVSIVYLILTFYIKNAIINNIIMFACAWEAICVEPLIYKLFKQPYNNYKRYVKRV